MDLRQKLSQRPHKPEVLAMAAYIGNDPARFAQLIDLVLEDGDSLSVYASWLINHCMKRHPWLIEPHLEALIHNLGQLKLNDPIVRSTVKALAEAPAIPEDLQGHALQYCFDYLLNPKVAVAIQVHSMQTVFNISKNEPDLLRELAEVIEERLPDGTAGYKSRGKRILKEIKKILAK